MPPTLPLPSSDRAPNPPPCGQPPPLWTTPSADSGAHICAPTLMSRHPRRGAKVRVTESGGVAGGRAGGQLPTPPLAGDSEVQRDAVHLVLLGPLRHSPNDLHRDPVRVPAVHRQVHALVQAHLVGVDRLQLVADGISVEIIWRVPEWAE